MFLASATLIVGCLGFAAPDAAARKNKRTKAQTYKTTLRVIVPDALDAAGVLRTLVADFQKRFNVGIKFIPADLRVALKLAADEKADVMLTADHAAARRFAKARDGLKYSDVMYTDLMIVGPAGDPARIAGMSSMITALQAIARTQAGFISRGDGSGTFLVEQRAWAEIGLSPKSSDNPWYTRTGADMRTTLGLAAAKSAYAITDRATWLRFRTRKQLIVMVDHDPRLMLRFGAIVLKPSGSTAKRARASANFVTWLTSRSTQTKIGAFQIGNDAPFTPHFGLKR
jgi:tungstate transport system substrate-binding protein